MEINEIKIGLKGNYAYLKNITVTGINDKHVIMSDVNGDTKEVFKSLFLKYFKEQHTQKKHHCTKCESKKENPWCSNCKEKDCVVSSDGTCAMIRRYLKPRCVHCKLSEQNLDLIAEVERLKCEKQKLLDALRPIAIVGNRLINTGSLNKYEFLAPSGYTKAYEVYNEVTK